MSRYIIIDDHPLICKAVHDVLTEKNRFDFVGEAYNVDDGWKLIISKKPDIVITDIYFNGVEKGIELCRKVKLEYPMIKVVILSMTDNRQVINKSFGSYCDGFITKNASSDDILKTMTKIRNTGEDSCLPHEQNVTVNVITCTTKLTARELEILRLVALGYTSKIIGQRLHISPKTVDNHRFSIAKKLNLHTPFDWVNAALHFGLIDPPQ